MECKRLEPNVTLTTSQCGEGTARYVSMGESGPSTGQDIEGEEEYQDVEGVYMNIPEPAETVETVEKTDIAKIWETLKKGRKFRLLMYVNIAIIVVALLIILAIFFSRVVSLENELKNEQEERESLSRELNEEKRARESLPSEDELMKEMEARKLLSEELNQEKRERESLTGELDQEKLARESLTRELDEMNRNVSYELSQQQQVRESMVGELRNDLDREVQARESLAGELGQEVQARESLAGELGQEVQARESLAGELGQEVQARESLVGEVDKLSINVSNLFSVAFHATVSAGHPTIRQDETLKFDSVKLNVGNSYDSTTGVFTVPDGSTGLYFFSTHLVTEDNRHAHFNIFRENDNLCGVYADNRGLGFGNSGGSCSVTVKLNSGDKVFVRRIEIRNASDNKVLYCEVNQCSFTGFLMKLAA